MRRDVSPSGVRIPSRCVEVSTPIVVNSCKLMDLADCGVRYCGACAKVIARFVNQDDDVVQLERRSTGTSFNWNVVQLEKDDHSELKVPRSRLGDLDQSYLQWLTLENPQLAF